MRPVLAGTVVFCLLATTVGAGTPDVSDGRLTSTPLPGGVAALMQVARLDTSTPRTQAIWALVRALHSTAPGTEPEADRRRDRVLAYLTRADQMPASPSDEDVPLPLTVQAWQAITGLAARDGRLAWSAILGNRSLALLYAGLLSADPSVRAFLSGRPALVDLIRRTPRIAVFATASRSLRIRDGRIDVPGGGEGVPLWEALVGAPATQAERFLATLLERDDGQLAVFYAAMDALDPARLALVLDAHEADAGRRKLHFSAIYAASRRALTGWRSFDRPFNRSLYDPGHLLTLTRLDGRGGLAGPAWQKFWERAFTVGDGSTQGAGDGRAVEAGARLDAASLVDLVCVLNATVRRQRAEAWLFAQRVFADVTPADLPDALIAVRGFVPFNALVLTLERLGIRRPRIYASAIVRASEMGRIKDPVRAAEAQAGFQGALALVERARLSKRVDVTQAATLIASLAALRPTESGEWMGAVARWVESDYLLVVGPTLETDGPVPDDRPLERQVIAAMAGRPRAAGAMPLPVVEVEGLRYRVDPAAADEARMLRVRREQGGWSLDEVLRLSRAADALVGARQGGPELARVASLLEEASAPFLAPRRDPPTRSGGVGPDVSRVVADAVRRVHGWLTRADGGAQLDTAHTVQRVVDSLLGETLLAVAYAPHLGDQAHLLLLGGDPSARHDWAVTEPLEADRLAAPWRLAEQMRLTSGGWKARGSLLALDVALGDLSLRRVFTESLPDPPTIVANDRAAFTEGFSLANAFAYSDEDRETIVRALGAGRARIEALQADASGLSAVLADAGIRDSRAVMLAWAIEHEADRVPDFFSMADWLRLGRLTGPAAASLDAWGASGRAREGCLCLLWPATGGWEALAGRNGKALAAALVPDLALQVAESLAERHLPASLTRAILAAATQDFEDDVRPGFQDDWLSMVRQVRKTLPLRMDDYIASLTDGPLVRAR